MTIFTWFEVQLNCCIAHWPYICQMLLIVCEHQCIFQKINFENVEPICWWIFPFYWDVVFHFPCEILFLNICHSFFTILVESRLFVGKQFFFFYLHMYIVCSFYIPHVGPNSSLTTCTYCLLVMVWTYGKRCPVVTPYLKGIDTCFGKESFTSSMLLLDKHYIHIYAEIR